MRNDHSHDGLQADVRRTASGALDTDYYHRRARVERADFLRAILFCIARCGWRAWGCIKTKMAGQVTRQELSALSTRELRDLGLTHGDFGALASGAYFTDLTRCVRSRERLKRCA